jgi:polysaccharide biosynthesis transport protein
MAEPSSLIVEARRYLGMLHKRRGLVATCVFVSLLVATLYNYTTRPVYQATAQILIDRRAQSLMPSTADRLDSAEITDLATQLEILRSQAMATRVVDKLQLHKTAEFATGPMMSPWERFQRRFMGKQPADFFDSAGIPLPPAAAAFRSRLSVSPVLGSRLFYVNFRAYDPKIAMDAVNTLAQVYIEETMNFRTSTSTTVAGWLGDRIREQQEKVLAAERAFQEAKAKQEPGKGEENGDLFNQKVTALTKAITDVRMDRLQREAILSQLRPASPSPNGPDPAVAANTSAAVQAARSRLADLQREETRLSETLGDKHPDMVKVRADIRAAEDKVQAETRAYVQSLDSAIQAAKQQETMLQENLDSARAQAPERSAESVELTILKREVENNQALLQDLQNKAATAGIETEVRATNVRIMEKAGYPGAPFSPNRRRNYQLALLIGLGLGVGLTVLLDYMDTTVRTPDDVKALGISFLGMVPDTPTTSGTTAGTTRILSDSAQSAAAEAYRVLRTNLIFTAVGRTGSVVVVSSANPTEGKTTTTANLGVSLALNGARVLLVDADMRRPALHQYFGAQKAPGLSDLIVGKAQVADAAQATRFKGLQILSCGYIPPNPSELLGSANMKALLEAFRVHYDWVLIDSPPILAMADTPVLCPLTDGMVLVMRAESTNTQSVLRAVDQVTGIGGKFLGAVLNRVDLRRNSYYYAQYYGEYYRNYYAEDSRKKRPVPVARPPARRA